MSKFSEQITDIMARKNLTQKQLAQMANVTESAMSYYVNGDRTPRIDVLRRLSGALGVSTDYLLGTEERSAENETELQYLQRILSKMNDEQLNKTEDLLRVVFEDLFAEDDNASESVSLPDEDIKFLYRDKSIVPSDIAIKLYTDITSIDKTGITFNDGSKIDFEECANNWTGGKTGCVAARNYGGNPAYFDFPTTGQVTRIVFCGKNSFFFKRRKNYEDFYSMQVAISNCGYRTYDLS